MPGKRGVVIGGLLLATGIAGAQVLQQIGVSNGDTKPPNARASQRLPLKPGNLAVPMLQPSAAPRQGAVGVSSVTGRGVQRVPAIEEGPPPGDVSFFTDPAQFERPAVTENFPSGENSIH